MSGLCPSFSNNNSSVLWYSDTTNIQRQTVKSAILRPT